MPLLQNAVATDDSSSTQQTTASLLPSLQFLPSTRFVPTPRNVKKRANQSDTATSPAVSRRILSVDASSVPSHNQLQALLPQTKFSPHSQGRSASVDSPRREHFDHAGRDLLPTPLNNELTLDDSILTPRNLDTYPHYHSPLPQSSPPQPSRSGHQTNSSNSSAYHRASPNHLRSSQSSYTHDTNTDYEGEQDETLTPLDLPSMPGIHKTPDLRLQVNQPSPIIPKRSDSIKKGTARLNPLKSRDEQQPGTVSSFFGWNKSRPLNNDSPSTMFSDSPASANPNGQHQTPDSPALDAYFGSDEAYSQRSNSPFPYRPPEMHSQVEELITELREVSAELAASIRREMDLEDELDKTDMPQAPFEHSRRTSDYYSDSGAGSARLSSLDNDPKIEGLEKMRRKAEQEKAQLRVDMAQKVQEDLNQRRALEMHIQSLEQQLNVKDRSLDEHRQSRDVPSDKERDLERKLNEEKQFKENFEDLLAGMRQEIEAHQSERDNLRDEVVPQLRSRLEGLESEQAERQKLIYEKTRIEQELMNLKNENATLMNARKLQMDMEQKNPRFKSIAEEDEPSSATGSLSRSNSLARRSSTKRRSSLVGGGSPNMGQTDGVPSQFKDIEDQRDALHRTLKAMIFRQNLQIRQHGKQVKALQMERDKLLNTNPRRQVFHTEVQSLRSEINSLRQRADDALEQKWQCEKGLGGLKMDLERAQQETSSLRELLQEHSISVPEGLSPANSTDQIDPNIESLDKAYAELKNIHANAVARNSDDTAASIEATTARMLQLSRQVDRQSRMNKDLRQRLAEAVGRGDKEQKANTNKINELQAALKAAEEKVVAAQSISDDAITSQEDHARQVSKTKADHTIRGLTTPNKVLGLGLNFTGALSATGNFLGAKSPKLDATSSGNGMSVQEASRTQSLENRVQELEAAARNAEDEMQGVVERMSRAQMEVAELQTERDEAIKQTRVLQREISAERERLTAVSN